MPILTKPFMAPNIHHVPTLSATKIKVARSCSRKYYYKYILAKDDRPVEEKSIYLLKGTALHSAIEEYYKHNTSPTATFQRVMLDTLDMWNAAGYIILGEDRVAATIKDGKHILSHIKWDHMSPIALEQRFLLPFPNEDNPICMIEGYIDMITTEGRVIDHKSNAKAPNKVELAHDPQFILYRWAYMQMYGIEPLNEVWHHLKTGEFIDCNVLQDYDQKLSQLQTDIMDIMQMSTYPRRLLDSECRQCPFFRDCYGSMEKEDTEE